MLWFILVRALFVLAVTYAAILTRPFSANLILTTVIGAALRGEGATARRRFRGVDETQTRPSRTRHPPEDSEDVRRRRHDLGRGLPRDPRSGPQAHRTRSDARRQDCDQRLQSEQGRAAAG